MPTPIKLSEVPKHFLDKKLWKSVRKYAASDIIALTYLNAPYPDENDPSDFFVDRRGSGPQAIECYKTCRLLLDQCRSLFSRGTLIATGAERKTGKREAIPSGAWLNLWPMFATNNARGPNAEYDDVTIIESILIETPHAKLASDCVSWLRQQGQAGLKRKKTVLYEDARKLFGDQLTHAIFDGAHLSAFGRARGRPRNPIKS
jgi:hypothetical protein